MYGCIEQCDHRRHERVRYKSCLMGKFRKRELTIGFIELSANVRDFVLYCRFAPSDLLSLPRDQRVLRIDAVGH
jgi:hypothetical protein